jgi:hypothetical protein
VRLPNGIQLWSAHRLARREMTLAEFCALYDVKLTIGV